MSRRGWALFAAMGLIWGIPYLLIKVAVDAVSPAVLVFVRTGVGAMMLLPVAAIRGELRPVLRRLGPVAAFTVAELAVPWLLLARAEQRLPSSLSGLLVAAVPLMGAVLARFGTAGERLDRRRLAGLLLGLVGVGALVGLDVRGADLVAVAEVAVVVVGYATGPLIVAGWLRDLPSLGVISVALGACSLVYLPVAVTQWPTRWPSASVIASLTTLGVLCTAVAFVVFFRLIAEVGPVRSTIITYVNPAVAVVLGVALLGEGFGLGTALGFVLVLAGCALATRPPGPVVGEH